ncbi:MAG TPA: hypothetical protein VGZ52_10190 [Acidimicrobiales bacterium]|jgi:hypothetical protein|nr:hypothetical protein [Acidimicrobiales bacterium]
MEVMSARDLFGLDPKEFVAARDQLARDLRARGEADDAKEVRALRRPTVPAWALNQVARDAPATIDRFLDATAAARVAQDDVLAGAGREVLQRGLADRRDALRAIVVHARDVLTRSGRTSDAVDREIEPALMAEPDAAFVDRLRRGELVDLAASGEADDDLSTLLSASTGAVVVPLRKRERTGPDPDVIRAAQEAEADAAQRLAAAEHALEVADRRIVEADAELARAKDDARVARRDHEHARTAHAKAAGALERTRRG